MTQKKKKNAPTEEKVLTPKERIAKLEADIVTLRRSNAGLKSTITFLTKQNEKYKALCDEIHKELIKERNKSIWKKLFG